MTMRLEIFLITLLLHGARNHNIVISEINAVTPDTPESTEFIELQLVDTDIARRFDSHGFGPSLKDYYLIVIKPSQTSQNEASVILYSNFSSYYFVNSSFFVVGDYATEPDVNIQTPAVMTQSNMYYNGIRTADNIDNGNQYPLGVILLHTNNTDFVREVLEMRFERPRPVVNHTSLAIVARMIIDMVIFAHRSPYSRCNVLDFLFHSICPQCNGFYVHRELDSSGYSDYSINNCDRAMHPPSNKSMMKLGNPTPGCPNDCSGAIFILEDNILKLYPDAIQSRSDIGESCTGNFSQDTYFKVSSKKIAKIRKYVISREKQAGKRQTGETSSDPNNNVIYQKRECSVMQRNTLGMSDNLIMEEDIVPYITANPRHVENAEVNHECFMRTASNNKNPEECGIESPDSILYRLSDFSNVLLDDKDSYTTGVENEAELILARGNGIFDTKNVDLNVIYVCGKHVQLLGKSVDFSNLKRKRAGKTIHLCAFPALEGVAGHSEPKQASRLFVSKDHSKAIYDMKKKLVPIGLPLCPRHYNFVKELLAEYVIHGKGYCLRPTITGYLAESPDIRPDISPTSCSTKDEHFVMPSELDESLSSMQDNVKKSIIAIVEEGKISKIHFTKNFKELATVTKLRYSAATTSLMRLIFRTIAPDDPEELHNLVCKSSPSNWLKGETSQLSGILDTVADCFRSGQTPVVRKHCLSIIAPFVSFSEIQRYIPGLSAYYYKEARMFASKHDTSFTMAMPKTQRIRYDQKKVVSFISFITSPHIVTDLPFGTSTVEFTSGEKEKIPKMLRIMIHERIVDQYLKYLDESNENEYALSRSSLLRILDYCKAGTRKSIHGLDYKTFKGMESFDNLIGVVKEIGSLFGDEWVSDISTKLKEAKLYLKGDYKLHIKRQSRIADHCSTFALSDKLKIELQARDTSHVHDMQCDNCKQMRSLLSHVKSKLTDKQFFNEQDKIEKEYIVEAGIDDIFTWQKHQLRSVHQDFARNDIIGNLQTTDVFLQLDWAMKFLPTSGREDQSAWFGKRGIPWHISHAFALINGILYSRTFIHVFDPLSQDSDVVIAIIQDLLMRIKREVPDISRAYVRSDNAGCYHSSQVIMSMHQLSSITGIEIQRWDFSEPQFGKGPCDRIAAMVKRQVRLYVNENNRCTNAEQFVICATAYKGLRGTSFVQSGVKFPVSRNTVQLPGISKYFNFQFSNDGIRAWRAYEVGSGVVFRHASKDNTANLATIISLNVYHENAKELIPSHTSEFWKRNAETSQKNAPPQMLSTSINIQSIVSEEDESDDSVRNRLFYCPEEGCTRSFMKHGNLLNHLILGNHRFVPQRTSLRDAAIQSYKDSLESVRLTPEIPELQEALQVFYETEYSDSTEMGWALKSTRACRPMKFSQRNFLLSKYNEGIIRKQKFNADTISKEMRRNPIFSKADFLTPQQITSFWSREASKRREEPATYYSGGADENVCDMNDIDEVFKDPALFDPHLEMESDLLNSDCFLPEET